MNHFLLVIVVNKCIDHLISPLKENFGFVCFSLAKDDFNVKRRSGFDIESGE